MKTQFKTLITACLCVSFFAITGFSGCDGSNPEPENITVQSFKVSGCATSLDGTEIDNGFGNDTIYVTAENKNLLKIQTTNTFFSCCASQISQSVEIADDIITINLY